VVETVEDPALQELLIADSDLDGVGLSTPFLEPGGDEGDIHCSSGPPSPLREGPRGPEEGDSLGSLVVTERLGVQKGGEVCGHLEEVIVGVEELLHLLPVNTVG